MMMMGSRPWANVFLSFVRILVANIICNVFFLYKMNHSSARNVLELQEKRKRANPCES